ncbi:MAG: AAA family ATPase [Myxococcota bacterium]
MLQEFRVHNYRNVSGGPFTFGRINVLIGPNNSGKSNMMDAIGFLSQLVERAPERGGITTFHSALAARGWDNLLDRRGSDDRILDLEWTFITDIERHEPFRYQISSHLGKAEQIPRGFFIEKEVLSFAQASQPNRAPFTFFECHVERSGLGAFSAKKSDGRPVREKLTISPQETVLQQVDALLEDERFRTTLYPQFQKSTRAVRQFFGRYRTYASTSLNLEQMSRAVPLDSMPRVLSTQADNYANVIKNLIEDERSGFLDAYLDRMRELLPELRDLRTYSAGEQNIVLKLKLGSQWYGLHELSHGTRKALLLCLLLFTPERYSVLSLDEPELNLHPAWLRVIGRWMQRFTSSPQLFISTHSPDLLDVLTEGFKAEEIRVFVFGAGSQPGPVLLNPATLREQFAEGWELGDLYRVGEPLLGGWPW